MIATAFVIIGVAILAIVPILAAIGIYCRACLLLLEAFDEPRGDGSDRFHADRIKP